MEELRHQWKGQEYLQACQERKHNVYDTKTVQNQAWHYFGVIKTGLES